MEPRIQYARTTDGFSIAYFAMGEGPAIVMMPGPLSNIRGESQVPGADAWHAGLMRGRMLVRYDSRGMGLSDRNVPNISVDTFVEDLLAVVDRLGLDRFVLLPVLFSSPAGIKFAALNPDRVSHLVLWCGTARGSEFTSRSTVALRAVRDQDWETYTAALGQMLAGWSGGEAARMMASSMREGASAEISNALSQMNEETDVSDLLDKVQAPTLVVHPKGAIYPSLDAARELVAGIPDAQLALLEGDSIVPYFIDSRTAVDAIDQFLGGSGTSTTAVGSGLRTVLFTDLVGHTEMMSRLGDERGREVLREHERITREVLKAHGGTEVKTLGDGFMASFGSVTRAVECAVALQRAVEEWNRGAGPQQPAKIRPDSNDPARVAAPLQVRVGLNAGEPIEEDGDLFGATVILASRIAAKAEGGEILVADTVRGLSTGKGFLFADRGEFVAKGFEEPVRVYEVRWHEPS